MQLQPRARAGAIVAGSLAAGAAYLLVPRGDSQALLYDGWSLAAAAIAWTAAARRNGFERRVAACIAAGCTAFAVGNVVWDVYEVLLDLHVPEPSIADVAYVSGYPFLFAAAVTLIRGRTRLDWVNAATDTAIVGIAVGLLVWEPVIIDATSNTWQALIAGAYPVFDVAIVGLLAVVVAARRASWATWMLLTGIVVTAVADFAYLVVTSRQPYESGTWIDALFIAGPLIMAGAPWAVGGDRPFSGLDGEHRPARPVAATAVVCASLVALPVDFGWAISRSPGRSDLWVRVGLRVLLLTLVAVRVTRQSSRMHANATALEAANHELARAATRLGAVMESTEDAVLFVDVDGRLLAANAAAQRMFDMPVGLAEGTLLPDAMPPDAVGRVTAALGPRVLDEPQQVLVPYTVEGRTSQILIRTTPVAGDELVPQGVVVVARDETRRVLRDVASLTFNELDPHGALRAMAAPLRELVPFDLLRLSMVAGDAMTEIARVRVTHAGVEDVAAPEFDRSTAGGGLVLPLREPTSGDVVGELAFGFTNESVATEDFSEALEVIGPIVARAVVIMREFAGERTAAERLRTIDQLREDFLSMVGHELRSPLGAISFAADVVRDQTAAADLAEATSLAAAIAEHARRLDRLISDLVDVGRGSFHCEFDTIEDPARAIVDAATAAAGDQRNRLQLRVEALPPLRADRGRLDQIVANLVSNALKFSRVGEPVTVSGYAKGGGVVIEVADCGIGVAPEQQRALFQRFTRLRTDVDGEEVSGTGLGLYITEQLVVAHGGTITYSRNAGPGSTFSVELPMNPAASSIRPTPE